MSNDAHVPDSAAQTVPAAPPCVRHAGAGAAYYCRECSAALCRDCVHSFGGRDDDLASCKKCGGKCDVILKKGPEEGRGSAVETPAEREARRKRDHVIPRWILGVAAGIQLGAATASAGPFLAILTLPVWVAVAGGLYGMLLYKLQAEMDDMKMLAVKAAAIGLSVHAVRLAAINLLGLDLPAGGDSGSMGLAMIGMLLPLGLCFVIIPGLLITAMVNYLFDMDMSEAVWAITVLMVGESFIFLLLKMGGIPA